MAGWQLGLGSFAQGMANGMNLARDKENERGLPENLAPVTDVVDSKVEIGDKSEQQNEQLQQMLAKQQEESRRQQEEAQSRISAQSSGGQQSAGVNPMQGLGIASKFMGGGSAAGGSAAGGSAAGSGAAGGAASSGSSAAGAASSAGPWAALAAVIAVNEYNAKKGGYRSENDSEYTKDLLTGKVMSQDVNERWAPKLFGSSDKFGLGGDMKAGAELSHGDFHGFKENLKDGTIGKLIKKIF